MQDEMLANEDKQSPDDKEALLITLQRPIVFVQPASFDKGQLQNQGTQAVMIGTQAKQSLYVSMTVINNMIINIIIQ